MALYYEADGIMCRCSEARITRRSLVTPYLSVIGFVKMGRIKWQILKRLRHILETAHFHNLLLKISTSRIRSKRRSRSYSGGEGLQYGVYKHG